MARHSSRPKLKDKAGSVDSTDFAIFLRTQKGLISILAEGEATARDHPVSKIFSEIFLNKLVLVEAEEGRVQREAGISKLILKSLLPRWRTERKKNWKYTKK